MRNLTDALPILSWMIGEPATVGECHVEERDSSTAMTNATVPTPAEIAKLASDTVKAINASMQKQEDWKTWVWRRFVRRREYFSQRRMLNRTCDYIEIIIMMLHKLRQDEDDRILERIRDHLQLLLDSKLHDMHSLVVCEVKNRLKIDALHLSKLIDADSYIYNRLRYERNIISKREELKTTGASASDVNIPSEELNAAWDLFLPLSELDSLLKAYQKGMEQHGIIFDEESGGDTETIAKKAEQQEPQSNTTENDRSRPAGISSILRDYAVTKLRYVYLSRHENNRYIATRSRIRSTYYFWLPLCLIILMTFLIFLEYIWLQPADQDMVYYPLVIFSGALGSVLAIILHFRSLNRITEFRNTASMLFAQTCVGGTAALIFFLILRAGWIQLAFLHEDWSLRDWLPSPDATAAFPPLPPLAEVILVAFFVGLSEAIFLRLVERMEGLMGGQGDFQSPAP